MATRIVEDHFPPYIFGIHDPGGEDLMIKTERPGWVLFTEKVSDQPHKYEEMVKEDLRVIVRLNHAYPPGGTLPFSAHYDQFARDCASFVKASKGCHIWIIGNEMNHASERPGVQYDFTTNTVSHPGEEITPARYADCFTRCRRAIRQLPGHEHDQVVIGAVAPWNDQTSASPQYQNNPEGDWVDYFREILLRLRGQCDGIAIHTYTHGHNREVITSTEKMKYTFTNRHYNFYAYRDFMDAIPQEMRDLPVYITETNPHPGWPDGDEPTGWVQAAYEEINRWNRDPRNQPIQALILYRWTATDQPRWIIHNRDGVKADLKAAMRHKYAVRFPGFPYRVRWLKIEMPQEMVLGLTYTARLRLVNEGIRTWVRRGENQMRLGYRWYNPDGSEADQGEDIRTPLPRSVRPNRQVTINQASVTTPNQPGDHVLRWDMIEEGVAWFHWHGSPRLDRPVTVVQNEYLVQWLDYNAPQTIAADTVAVADFELVNRGSKSWAHDGPNPVHLGYRWRTVTGEEVPVRVGIRHELPQDVPPGGRVKLTEVQTVAPDRPGNYVLVWDLVEEGITWFEDQDSPPLEKRIEVTPPPYGVEWLAPTMTDWPARVAPGQALKLRFRLRNTGAKTWTAFGLRPVHLAYHWFTPGGQLAGDWNTFRASLPHDVGPGQEVVLPEVVIRAPSTSGDYMLRCDLVEEGVAWFSREGAAPLEVSIQVLEEDATIAVWKGEASHHADQVGRAFDANPDTFWSSQDGQEPGMWFELDLGKNRLIERLKVESPGRGFPIGYRLLVAARKGAWKLIDLQERNWTSSIDALFSPCQVRYLKIEQTGQSKWPWLIAEISVGLAEAWAEAKASHNPAGVAQAFDGNQETAWSSKDKQQPGMWFELDLGAVRTFDGLRVDSPRSYAPRGYLVSTSKDGQQWQVLAEKPDNWHNIDLEFDQAPRQARYIRIEQTNSSNWHPWAISNVGVRRVSPAWLRGR